MAEYYLAQGFALGELARARSARILLQWAGEVAAEAQPADVYRDKEGRKTLRFMYRTKPFFLKLHSGIGWVEIFKNLIPKPGIDNHPSEGFSETELEPVAHRNRRVDIGEFRGHAEKPLSQRGGHVLAGLSH